MLSSPPADLHCPIKSTSGPMTDFDALFSSAAERAKEKVLLYHPLPAQEGQPQRSNWGPCFGLDTPGSVHGILEGNFGALFPVLPMSSEERAMRMEIGSCSGREAQGCTVGNNAPGRHGLTAAGVLVLSPSKECFSNRP